MQDTTHLQDDGSTKLLATDHDSVLDVFAFAPSPNPCANAQAPYIEGAGCV